MYVYYYNNDKKYPTYITDSTKTLSKYNFLDHLEDTELQLFFGLMDVNKKVTIVDIGARSGLYTLYAKYLPLSTFYSFEPNKVKYDLLCDNIQLNNITNVFTYNIALSNEKGTDTLDNIFFENDIDVNFIKIDTEGFEYYILEGGKKTICKNRPIIQLECDITEEKMNDMIKSLGYKVFNKHTEGMIIIPEVSESS